MQKLYFILALLFSVLTMAQHTRNEKITVSEPEQDDIYLAAETIHVDAIVDGDVVVAGSRITVRDSIRQDLIVAGGEIIVKGYVADDIRAAGGKLTIDSEIGDDVIIAGGEVFITENAVIRGNLINFSGDIKMNGEVKGMLKSYSGDLELNGKVHGETKLYGEDIHINGEILGPTKMAAEDIEIGATAKFHSDVEYWSEDRELDFKNHLINATATYNEALIPDGNEFSWKRFGMLGIGFVILYILSAFLILLLLNWGFSNWFSEGANNFDKDPWKSLGYGLIYFFGVPLLIVITFLLIIGIPISLFLLCMYVFSLLHGHLVTALLITHYLNKNSTFKFWNVVFTSLGIAIVLRLLTLIPFLGGLLSIIVIAIGYGLLITIFLKRKKHNLQIAK